MTKVRVVFQAAALGQVTESRLPRSIGVRRHGTPPMRSLLRRSIELDGHIQQNATSVASSNLASLVKPETLIGWHRKGFTLFWKWKSQAGRPRIPENIRKLIVQMAQENPTWGQARVAAELSVKLGISMFLHVRCAPIGLPSRSDGATGGPLRRTGGRLSAIMPSPSSPAISWLW